MPFDSLTMAAVSDEIRAVAVGGRIQKIIQPSGAAVALSVYRDGAQRWILLSADARYARVTVSEGRLAKAFPTPSAFVMLLRKHLEGARLQDVSQMPRERILVLGFPHVRLVAEVMGKHSNVILVSEADRVLGALKNVPPRESRVRPILPGYPYVPPPGRRRDESIFPAGPLVDAYLEPVAFATAVREADKSVSLRSALLGLLAGCGPFLADQVALRAGVRPGTRLGEVSIPLLLEAGQAMYKRYHTREWEPSSFSDLRGRPDFAPYTPIGMDEVEAAPTISAAIERALGGLESRDALGTVRKSVFDRIERSLHAVERRIESLQKGLGASAGAEEVMQAGQLVLAYQYLLQPKASELIVPDVATTIPLDPLLSPSENAERMFRRYRKLRDSRKRIPLLLSQAQSEEERLRDLAAFVPIADTEADLRSIERDISPAKPDALTKKRSSDKRRGPRRFSWKGYTALVGRTARENEEVTFRLSRRDDLWLHARKRTGAHVILQGGSEPPSEVLEEAAALAAYFSDSRNDTAVDVDTALVRDVRKIPGGPPGRVTYRKFRTIRVEPSLGEWQAV